MAKETLVIVTARGAVYGHFWGGGEGAYPSETVTGKTEAEVLERANKLLRSGALDSGMGFASLTGAKLRIEKRYVIEVGGRRYGRSEGKTVYIGELSQKQKLFLARHYG